jgi:hypothetical protein
MRKQDLSEVMSIERESFEYPYDISFFKKAFQKSTMFLVVVEVDNNGTKIFFFSPSYCRSFLCLTLCLLPMTTVSASYRSHSIASASVIVSCGVVPARVSDTFFIPIRSCCRLCGVLDQTRPAGRQRREHRHQFSVSIEVSVPLLNLFTLFFSIVFEGWDWVRL